MEANTIIVCRCEEVSLLTLLDTMQKHACSPRELKLRTRAGMGSCGGRICSGMLTRIAGQEQQHEDGLPLKIRPPIRPLSFREMGGMQ